MEIGLFTSGYQRGDIETAFSDAKKFGYDFIELWGGRPHAYPNDIEICGPIIKRLIKKYSISVKIYTPEMNAYPFNMMWENEIMRKDSINYVKRSMDFAKIIGAEYTLISAGHAGFASTDKEITSRLIKGLEEIIGYAEKINHKIIYESLSIYESNVTNSANQMKEILDYFDSPYLYGMNDIVVPFIQGEQMTNYLDKLGEKCIHMHIIDSDGQTENHICPGQGILPLKYLMSELEDKKYDKSITIELVTNYINEPSIYSKMAIDNIRGYA